MVSPQQQAAPALTLDPSPLGKKRTLSRNGQVLGHLRVKGLGETKYFFTIGAQKWRVWPVGSDVVLWDLFFNAEVARIVFTYPDGGGFPIRRLVVNEPAWRPQFDLSLRWEDPPSGLEARSLREIVTAPREKTWALVDEWDRRWLTFRLTGHRTKVEMTQPFAPWPAADPEWGLMVAAALCCGEFVSSAVSSAQAAQAGGSDNLWLTT